MNSNRVKGRQFGVHVLSLALAVELDSGLRRGKRTARWL